MRILIVGASGSGTTTLGAALARRLACAHLDTDDFFWLPTTPAYQRPRDPAQRLSLLGAALEAAGDAVVSGSLAGWGEALEDSCGAVVFLWVPTGLRLERLRAREVGRFGQANPAFLQWASEYDAGPVSGRSLAKHRAWFARRAADRAGAVLGGRHTRP